MRPRSSAADDPAAANEALAALQADFSALYSGLGRLDPAGAVLRAMLLQAFYFDPLRAPADGAARPSTSCSAGSWRLGVDDPVLGPLDLLQEP